MNALAISRPEYLEPAMPDDSSPAKPIASAWAERQGALLAWQAMHMIALEANGLRREASRMVDHVTEGQARRPTLVVVEGSSELPEHERGRGEFDLRELDRINARLLANSYKRKGDKSAEAMREDDLRRRETLERRPAAKADQRWLRDATAETMALAEARGEAVTEDKAGVRRILDRDPLLSIARLGKITPEQLEAGQVIREAFERRGDDAGAVEFTGMPGSAHDHEKFVSSRFTRAKATILIGQVTTAILTGHFRTSKGYTREVEAFGQFKALKVETHLGLAVLRAVCGEGKSLSSQGEGRALARNAQALALALDVAEEVIGSR